MKNRKIQKSSRIDIDECSAKNITFAATVKAKQIKTFVSIIKALSFVNNTEVQIWDCGFKYYVEESKSFQGIACLKQEFFEQYHLRLDKGQESARFGVSLNSFTDLLAALVENDSGSMNITYYQSENRIVFAIKQIDSGEAQGFKLKMKSSSYDDEDIDPAGEMVTEYYIKTMHSIEPIDFGVQNPHFTSSLILDSGDLLGILNDFDKTLDEIEIKITHSRLVLKSVGSVQLFSIAKIKSDSEAFSKYDVDENSRFTYKFKCFKAIMRGLPLSTETSIDTHINGTLRVQIIMKNEEEASAIVEYNLVPSLPDSDSEPEM